MASNTLIAFRISRSERQKKLLYGKVLRDVTVQDGVDIHAPCMGYTLFCFCRLSQLELGSLY